MLGLPSFIFARRTIDPGFGGPAQFGELLLTRFLIPFEAASYLLLIAAVGALVLARKRRGFEDMLDTPLPPAGGRA